MHRRRRHGRPTQRVASRSLALAAVVVALSSNPACSRADGPAPAPAPGLGLPVLAGSPAPGDPPGSPGATGGSIAPVDPVDAARRTLAVSSGRAHRTTVVRGVPGLPDGRPAEITATWSHHGHRLDVRSVAPGVGAELLGVDPQLVDRAVLVRVVDGAVFVTTDPPAERWVRYPLGEGIAPELLAQLHPAAVLAVVEGVDGWRHEGPGPAGGGRHVVRLSLVELLGLLSPAAAPAIGPAAAGLPVGRLVLDVDPEGRARRLEIAFVVDAEVEAEAGLLLHPDEVEVLRAFVMSTVVEWSDLGTAPDVGAPPPDSIVEAPTP